MFAVILRSLYFVGCDKSGKCVGRLKCHRNHLGHKYLLNDLNSATIQCQKITFSKKSFKICPKITTLVVNICGLETKEFWKCTEKKRWLGPSSMSIFSGNKQKRFCDIFSYSLIFSLFTQRLYSRGINGMVAVQSQSDREK